MGSVRSESRQLEVGASTRWAQESKLVFWVDGGEVDSFVRLASELLS